MTGENKDSPDHVPILAKSSITFKGSKDEKQDDVDLEQDEPIEEDDNEKIDDELAEDDEEREESVLSLDDNPEVASPAPKNKKTLRAVQTSPKRSHQSSTTVPG